RFPEDVNAGYTLPAVQRLYPRHLAVGPGLDRQRLLRRRGDHHAPAGTFRRRDGIAHPPGAERAGLQGHAGLAVWSNNGRCTMVRARPSLPPVLFLDALNPPAGRAEEPAAAHQTTVRADAQVLQPCLRPAAARGRYLVAVAVLAADVRQV